jgi:hypothetical protein
MKGFQRLWPGALVLYDPDNQDAYALMRFDAHTAFDQDSGVQLNACSYLHNYAFEPSDVLFADRFKSLLESFPTIYR